MLFNKKLFTFAVVGDTHIITKNDVGASPYPVNDLATERSSLAIKKLKLLNPDFIIHIGDMVRPFPSLKSYHPACKKAKTMFSNLGCDLHFIPGNHDIGDKPNSFAPAPIVSDYSLKKYKSEFGNYFYSFDNANCHFILLNSSLMNSHLIEEKNQFNWLINDLKSLKTNRVFVFLHYPLFLASPDERAHYDNIEEPARGNLLKLFSKFNIEAVFSGHVHQFFYNVYKKIDMYCVPSTSFLRHDFSELFHIKPTKEFGRNDFEKLGFFLVDIYETHHSIRFIKIVENEKNKNMQTVYNSMPKPKNILDNKIGIKFRHDWNNFYFLPHNSPLDEFTRKKARNDYSLLATWQTGITHLRVPFDDLRDENSIIRMKSMIKKGQKFTFFYFGIFDNDDINLLKKYYYIIDILELIVNSKDLPKLIRQIKKNNKEFEIKYVLGILESSSEDITNKSKYFRHSTSFGINLKGSLSLESFFKQNINLFKYFYGFSFQIDIDDNIWEKILIIEKHCKSSQIFPIIHINLYNEKSSIPNFDDYKIANKSVLALIASYSIEKGTIFLDTIMDIDRGSHPRNGFVDRRGNFRLSVYYFQKLIPKLSKISKNSKLVLEEILQNKNYILACFSNEIDRFAIKLKSNESSSSDIYFETHSDSRVVIDLLK